MLLCKVLAGRYLDMVFLSECVYGYEGYQCEYHWCEWCRYVYESWFGHQGCPDEVYRGEECLDNDVECQCDEGSHPWEVGKQLVGDMLAV